MSPVLFIVIPCYNEEEVLPETAARLTNILEQLVKEEAVHKKSRILFVDDGSSDKTWQIITSLCTSHSIFQGIKLSRNCGHQNALLAGLMTAKAAADCVISIDADLQDDIDVIPEFVDKFCQGFDVVYGVRKNRRSDHIFKRLTAQGFYRFMIYMGVNLVYNHADYRLLSRRALESLSGFGETNLFLRGVIPLIGYNSCAVYYDRQERFAGSSKYPLKKMLTFAWQGITSFSVTPIRRVWQTGFLMLALTLMATVYVLGSKIWGSSVPGWTSTMLSIWFIGSIQLLSVGIIGEYVGKIYQETKARPKYIIEGYLENHHEG